MPVRVLLPRKEAREAAFEPVLVQILAPSTPGAIYGATIVNISRSGMRISMPISAEPGTDIAIRRSDPKMECLATVRYCRADTREDVYYIGVQLAAPLERRKEPRYAVRERGMLTVLATDVCRPRPATLVDVSKSGFSAQVREWIPVGGHVLMTLETHALVGTVRNIRDKGDGLYIIGVSVSDVIAKPAEKPDARNVTTGMTDTGEATRRKRLSA